jgi:acetyl esterase/lipase
MKMYPIPSVLFSGLVLAAAIARGADAPPVLDVWPGAIPGEAMAPGPEKVTGVSSANYFPSKVTNISHPTLTVFRPAKEKDTGIAVIVCPGGGFRELDTVKEGEDAVHWLNGIGITGIVLKYRVPTPKDLAEYVPALQDGQRALSLVRSKAAEWGIKSDHIGIMGFSAGAQLSIRAGTQFAQRTYPAVDAIDDVSCRPDFAIVIYPGGLVTKDGTDVLVSDVHVPKDSCQMFFAQAETDRVNSDNSILTFLALKRAGVSAEMHIYAVGAHGFGLKPGPDPHSSWPKRCEEWLASQGIWKKTD